MNEQALSLVLAYYLRRLANPAESEAQSVTGLLEDIKRARALLKTWDMQAIEGAV